MARPTQDVTEAELAVLQALWDGGAATIRQLADAIYGQGDAAHYATVQKLLERLESKGFVSRDRSGAVHRFSAAIDREELIGRRLRDLAESLCGGSMTPLLTHLVRTRSLSADERKALRDLVDRLDARNRGRSSES